jgi:hypothetical protein
MFNSLKKIKIQLIGTFTSYIVVELDAMELVYFETIAKRLGVTLSDALIDPYFYYLLRLEKYQSYLDLEGSRYFGLDIHSFHQIELFVNGHKKQKFSYFDLNPENVLFPLYKTDIISAQIFLESPILIRTKEKGSINFVMQYPLAVPMDEILSFTLFKTDNELLISKVNFAKNNLPINKSDTVIVEQFVLLNIGAQQS